MRKYAILLALAVLSFGLAACEDNLPPTQIIIIVTATDVPVTEEVAAPIATDAVADVPTDAAGTEEAVGGALITPNPDLLVTAEPADATPTPEPTTLTTTPGATTASVTAAPTTTATPDFFPTPVRAQVPIAEQVYEHGRMFWIRHTREIWVMAASEEDPNRGDWFCYNDTFEEGEPEIDPTITAPEGLIQPRRGFGKLWRSHPEIKEAVGWATTPEFELTSDYTYLAGGTVENGGYIPGPGEHRMTTFEGDTISFFEGDIRGDCRGGTWRLHEPQAAQE